MSVESRIRIRKAQPDDAEDILLVASVLGYSTISMAQLEKTLATLLTSSDHKVWVAEQDTNNAAKGLSHKTKRVIGWVHAFYALRLASSNFVEIGGLAVCAEKQGLGVGRTLVATVHEWADSLNCSLRVRCNENRKEALLFYQALGFICHKNQQVLELTE